MEKVTLEVGDNPRVVIKSVGGDLRVSGREDSNFEAQAPDKGKLKVVQDGDRVEVSCKSGCLIFLPSGAEVEGEEIGGDVRLTGFTGEAMIRVIGGDLSLRHLGSATFELIGGDLHARKMTGDLTVDRVGGDAVIESVEGEVRMRAIGGDLMLHRVVGSVNAVVGGDASVSFDPKPGSRSELQAGSDIGCRLPEEASARVSIQAGGESWLPGSVDKEETEDGTVLVLGKGEAEVDLRAGGDLKVQAGSEGLPFAEDMVGDILGEVDAKLAEMEARFNAMGAGLYGFDADRVGERVRRAVARAQRKAEKGRRSTRREASARARWPGINLAGMGAPREAVSDAERLAVLRMVEKGKISVDEAEKLLQTLEGES